MHLRFWPVFLRNLLVWRKLLVPSLIANIAEPLMWLVAFGYGMGALVGQVSFEGQQVPYILFLASGSICMSAMNAATFEALYSAFSRMHVQKNMGRHHERASALGRCVVGRNALGCI
jgi:lipooligosaccharide transport system permease protein